MVDLVVLSIEIVLGFHSRRKIGLKPTIAAQVQQVAFSFQFHSQSERVSWNGV